MPPKPIGTEMDAVSARLDELRDEKIVDDQQLAQLLQPFRGHPPIKLRCPKTGCRRTVEWCALHASWNLAMTRRLGPRKGYVEKINKHGPAPWLRQQPAAPFDYWSLGPGKHPGSAMPPEKRSETVQRWTLQCPQCQSPYTVTNRTLIKYITRALTGNSREIPL